MKIKEGFVEFSLLISSDFKCYQQKLKHDVKQNRFLTLFITMKVHL